MTGGSGAGRASDPRLRHDVSAVLALPWPQAESLVPALAHDALGGAYGDDVRLRYAALLHPPVRGPFPRLVRRLDVAAAADRLASMPAADVATSLRRLADGP